ncbi:MAG: response regulator [Campylobacterales bacterium]|nr:response regulator [Campylobacterales bacterium]
MNYLSCCNLLYLEDNDKIRENMSRMFRAFCAAVTPVASYEEAIEALNSDRYCIAVCDIELGGGKTGLDLIKHIREGDKDIQILILSSKRDEKFLLDAIKLNLVEYLIKPVSFDQMERALNNCALRLEESGYFRFKLSEDIYFALQEGLIYNKAEKIALGEKENLLLSLLVKKRGKILTKEEIEAAVYSFDATDSAIKSLFNKLRRKIGKDIIESLPGLGYRLNLE